MELALKAKSIATYVTLCYVRYTLYVSYNHVMINANGLNGRSEINIIV